MGQVGRGGALPLHSSPHGPSGPVDLGSPKVTTPPLLAKEAEGVVEEAGRWGIPVVRTASRESRRSLQDWAQAAEVGMPCGPWRAEWWAWSWGLSAHWCWDTAAGPASGHTQSPHTPPSHYPLPGSFHGLFAWCGKGEVERTSESPDLGTAGERPRERQTMINKSQRWNSCINRRKHTCLKVRSLSSVLCLSWLTLLFFLSSSSSSSFFSWKTFRFRGSYWCFTGRQSRDWKKKSSTLKTCWDKESFWVDWRLCCFWVWLDTQISCRKERDTHSIMHTTNIISTMLLEVTVDIYLCKKLVIIS